MIVKISLQPTGLSLKNSVICSSNYHGPALSYFRLLGIIYNSMSFESSLEQGFIILSLNDVASLVAQLVPEVM